MLWTQIWQHILREKNMLFGKISGNTSRKQLNIFQWLLLSQSYPIKRFLGCICPVPWGVSCSIEAVSSTVNIFFPLFYLDIVPSYCVMECRNPWSRTWIRLHLLLGFHHQDSVISINPSLGRLTFMTLDLHLSMYRESPKTHGISSSRISSWSKWTGVSEKSCTGEKQKHPC